MKPILSPASLRIRPVFAPRWSHTAPQEPFRAVKDQRLKCVVRRHDLDMSAEMDKRDFRLPAIGNLSGRVKRNGVPDDVDFFVSG
ncbi:hypothetical protein [Paraburkholderia sp. BL27I4N3]|uniref:hypothetical protein n=1 Tax=Paraburkholderia sp. BL27I4N3 TaxID=1938805 RepID=UPI0015F2849D|nr:hypothetical protein [Paraburkholderia sp. BL27I4N3]